ncbi:MAG: hypothetical protein WAO83_21450 [Fuerstiella sp.]|jgi:hypothetical protein
MFQLKNMLAVLAIFSCNTVSAQTSQLFQVSIDPEATILSLSGDQFQNHPGVEGNLNFFESDWFVESNTSAGASVTFSAGPFVNQGNPAYRRDTSLRLRNLRNRPGASWAFDNQADRTRYSNGKLSAVVTMSSAGAGTARVGMRVRFLTELNPAGTLPAGSYVTTVTGTISAN